MDRAEVQKLRRELQHAFLSDGPSQVLLHYAVSEAGIPSFRAIMDSSTTPPGTPPSELPSSETSLPDPSSPHAAPPLLQSQDDTSEHSEPSSSPLPKDHWDPTRPKNIPTKKEHHQKPYSSRTLNQTLKRHLSQSNDHIHHLNRLLTTTPTLDLILSTTSYTLALLSTLLPPIPSNPNSQPHLHHRLSTLSSLLSETRTTLRLFGLIPIYTWAHSTYHHSPPTLTNHITTTTQILAGIAFQTLENVAYLGDKSILPLSPQRRAKYWRWCCWAWAVHVFLELAKLLLLARKRQLDADSAKVLKDEKSLRDTDEAEMCWGDLAATKKQQQETESWWRDLKINLAYAPMTLHYSLANGLLNDSTVALCGVLASYWGLKGAWMKTATAIVE
ncbi:MAG: hypothetical protein LQ339_001825 [Xanthoria mediterranea]|nr:MAG: hypothetical protein LQ339_001825 [Xanthoria mediterranea]